LTEDLEKQEEGREKAFSLCETLGHKFIPVRRGSSYPMVVECSIFLAEGLACKRCDYLWAIIY
jgi:hypothetical protein